MLPNLRISILKIFKLVASSIQNYMKRVRLDRIPNEVCNDKIKASGKVANSFKLHESFICAGGEVGEDKDVCKGDGGGPLLCKQTNVKK